MMMPWIYIALFKPPKDKLYIEAILQSHTGGGELHL